MNKGYTLIELLVTIVIITTLLVLCTVALLNSRIDSTVKSKRGVATLLNQGRERAINDELDNPVLFGNDVDALEVFLIERGYIAPLP